MQKILLLFIWLMLLAFPLPAHELGAVQADITFKKDGAFQIDVQVDPEHLPLSMNPFAGLPPVVPENELQLRKAAFQKNFLEKLQLAFDGQACAFTQESLPSPATSDPSAAWRFGFRLIGLVPKGARSFTWSHPAKLGQYLLRFRTEGELEPQAQWVEGGRASQPFALSSTLIPQSKAGKIALYMKLGFTHILPEGTDHILFVLGLFFLSLRFKPVLLQVTTFTVAHSLTLGLSLFGVLSLSPKIVEPLIALSIVYVAVENVLTDQFKPWRLAVVFSFGLLHGLGFAGALRDLQIPSSDFLSALVSFNAGVELGQLSVILLAFIAVGLAFGKRPWYRGRVSIPASVLIGATGLYWTAQRVFF